VRASSRAVNRGPIGARGRFAAAPPSSNAKASEFVVSSATYVFIAFCLIVYVVVALTGIAPLASIIWPIANLLTIIAIVSRIAAGSARLAQSRRRLNRSVTSAEDR
jgi:uncharacterized MAPEG superfamily protein